MVCRRVRGVKSGEDEVARVGRPLSAVSSGIGGRNFSNQDHVRILAENPERGPARRSSCPCHLALVDMASRCHGAENSRGSSIVMMFAFRFSLMVAKFHRRERRRLPRSGDTSHEHKTTRLEPESP